MIEIMLGIFITHVANGSVPWNTTGVNAGNFLNSPNIVQQNIPWFFPLLTLILLLVSDYYLSIKMQLETRINLFAVALSYTVLSYIEVLGQLSTTNYFFIFEFIMLICLMVMVLFKKRSD